MVLLELFGVDDAEVATNPARRLAAIGGLELLVFLLSKVSHGALELGNDSAGSEGASGENAQFRFACAVGISLGMGDLDGACGEVELKISGCMPVGEGRREMRPLSDLPADMEDRARTAGKNTYVANALSCF